MPDVCSHTYTHKKKLPKIFIASLIIQAKHVSWVRDGIQDPGQLRTESSNSLDQPFHFRGNPDSLPLVEIPSFPLTGLIPEQ